MLAELVAAGAALLVGGSVGAWQYAIARRKRKEATPNLSARGPYRQGETPGSVVDPQTGGYPMPPSFDDDGWTPKA
ncbi:MAG: hypothetical protein U0326_37205 [Polyangiales bacterium]